MNVPSLPLTRRTGVAAAAAAVVIAICGWAFAAGEVPLVSSTAGSTSTSAPASPGANTDNVAVATNTHDGKTVVALSIKIVQTDSDTVDAVNAAVAVASCTDCQTVAIALEGVLVIGDPATFAPTNIALAINEHCTNCQTLAAAYQTVVQNETRVRISGAGRREIAAIRTELLSLRHSGLDIFAIWERVNDAAGRFLTVLQNEVYPIGRPPHAGNEPKSASQPAPSAAVDGTTTTSSSTTTTAPAEPATTTSSTSLPPA